MRRFYYFFVALLILSTDLFAAPISESVAREKAAKFIRSKNGSASEARSVRRFGGSVGGSKLTMAESREAFYVYNIGSDGGYVIVSGDDRMPEVLGYSYEGTYNADDVPANMRGWLEGYAEQYEYLQTHSDAQGATIATVTGSAISPLLDCQWDQWAPYNSKCPKLDGKRTLTGCVATAMAQIMYYHKWPKQTTREIPAYTAWRNGIQVPAIGITAIDWENMTPTYSSSSTAVQEEAVANLMLLCGSAVQMNYGLNMSDAGCSSKIFIEYFGYNNIAISDQIRRYYNDTEWNQLIYDELKSNRPVYYDGHNPTKDEGHAFVIDGYDKNDYFHVNWGWGGSSNGYFLLSTLNGYSIDQHAITGICHGQIDSKLPYEELKNGVLTFYYDNKHGIRSGTLLNWYNYDYWYNSNWENDEYKKQVTKVVFDPSCAEFKKLIYTGNMFKGFTNLTSIQGLEYLVTENTTDMSNMFFDCSSLTTLDVSHFNTQNVTNMQGMFVNCKSLTSLDVSHFDTQNVKDMSGMFKNCSSLTSLDVSHFNTQNVESMPTMFYDCKKLTSLDVSKFDTRNVTNMFSMFYNCNKLTSLDVSNFDTRNVTDMYTMFSNCSSLTSLDVSHFDTQNATRIGGMFEQCSSLTSLDLSKFNTQNVTANEWLFGYCSNLKSVVIGKKVASIGEYAFFNCNKLTDVYCYSQTVPTTESSAFTASNISNATLYVPKASLASYNATAPWSGFGSIQPLAKEEVIATSIALDANSLSMDIGETYSLKATVLPAEADQEVTWSSTYPAVATVDKNGLVRAVAGGIATIKATTTDGSGLTATCVVTVAGGGLYIETDVTSQFPTDWNGWNGATGYTATQYAPKVTTNDGRTVQVCERYNGNSAATGTVFTRTLSGLTNGTYRIELYGAAASTKGRDTNISSDMTAADEGDETAVYLYAKTASGVVKQYIPVHWATSFSEVATAVLNGVKITDGTVEIGMYSDKKYTNWHVVQIKGVTALVDIEELYANVLQKAQAALADTDYANIVGQERIALVQAVRQYSVISEQTLEAYQAAVKALETATGSFTDAKESYDEWAQIKNLSFPYASAEKKSAAETAAAVNPTSASDAVSKTESMIPLFRSYAESSALMEGVEGSENVTDTYILNPRAEETLSSTQWQVSWGEGSPVGGINIKADQPWTDASGNSNHRYFDGGYWGASSWDATMQQDITLPAGHYQLTVIGRSAQDVQLTLFAGNMTAEMAHHNDIGGLFNNGWEQTSVEFELMEQQTISIGVRGVTSVRYNWMSFSDFRLVKFPTQQVIDIAGDRIVTYSSSMPLDFSEVKGLKAYIASGFNPTTGSLLLTPVTEVPAGEGLVLKGETGSYTIPFKNTDMFYANLLKGVTKAIDVEPINDNYTNYILSDGSYGVGFYPLSAATRIAKGQAYLQLPISLESPAEGRIVKLEFLEDQNGNGESPTGIVHTASQNDNTKQVFNLQGQRMQKLQKGLYIINGKKVVTK